MRRRHLIGALLLLAVTLTLMLVWPTRAADGIVRLNPAGGGLLRPDGRPFFVLGYNYEGPFDRAWRMWQQFDRALIAADLARARAGGANTVRIFVQHPLPAEVLAGDFTKLDAVVQLAAEQDLFVLLTFADYAERDLTALAEVGGRIAAHYRDHPAILAYDLRNEPQFFTLATAIYPADLPAPLQRSDLVAVYGERVARADLPAYRASAAGRPLPASWSDDQVYAYANNLAFFRAMIADAERWVLAAPGRSAIGYLSSPEAAGWRPLAEALDGTLRAWITAQTRQIRPADPARPITIGWSNTLLASLPANGELLEIISYHSFPRATPAGIAGTLTHGATLRRLFPTRPVLFEEVGISNATVDEQASGVLEGAMLLRAYSEGFAGYLKWMLTDLPPVGDPVQDRYGGLRTDSSAKPIHRIMGAFGAYLAATAAAPGGLVTVGDGPTYRYETSDVFYAGGSLTDGAVEVRLAAPGQLALRRRGAMMLLATQPGSVTLDLRQLMPAYRTVSAVERREGDTWAPVDIVLTGDRLTFAIAADRPHRVQLTSWFDPATAQAGCQFFAETGHSLCGTFLAYWQRAGGLTTFGYPISEAFPQVQADGVTRTVQYFERNRFELHPEHAGTDYEVLLGLLGNELSVARRSEPAFQPLSAAPAGRDFFAATGHTLGGAFRSYWRQHGGLAIFGYPISEEFQEYRPETGQWYTVQYFERNRFEYHPEHAGTPFEVQLGLLGNQLVDSRGWR